MNSITQTLQRVGAIVSIVGLVVSLPGAAFAQYSNYYDTYGYDDYYDSGYTNYYDVYGYDDYYDSGYGDYYDSGYTNYYDVYGYDDYYDSGYTNYYDVYGYDDYYDSSCYDCGYYDSYDYYGGYYDDYYGGYDDYYGGGGFSQPSGGGGGGGITIPISVSSNSAAQSQSQSQSNNTNNNKNDSSAAVVGSGNSQNTIIISSPTPTQTQAPTQPPAQQTAQLSADVEIRNLTDGGSFATFASADAGDVVAVAVNYRNLSSIAIPNTRLSLNQPSGATQSHTFTGSVQGDNAPAQSDTALLSLFGTQDVTPIPGAIFWRPAGGSNTQSFPSGQNGNEIFAGNLNIGTLTANAGGYVEAHFRVGSANTGGPTQSVNVTTVSATNITQSSATLNGFVSTTGGFTSQVRFEYGLTSSFGNTTNSQSFSGSQNFAQSISGLSPNTTYFYRAVASSPTGNVFGSTLSFTTSGSVQTALLVTTEQASQTGNSSTFIVNGRLNSAGTNQSTATTYFEYGRTTSLGSRTNNRSTGVSSFSETISGLSSNTTYFYRAVAQNNTGTDFGTILSFTTGGSIQAPVDVAPIVTTNTATRIDRTSSRLNGFASMQSGSTGNLSVGWFEWGASAGLGNRTNNVSLAAPRSASFFDTLNNLAPNTTYFYRAVARSTTGQEGRGATLTFTTDSSGAVSVPSGIALRADKTVVNRSFPNGTDTEIAAWGGNTLEFTIRVTNTGSQTLSNLIVRDRIADSVTLKDIDGGGSRVGNSVEWNTTLSPGQTQTFVYRVVGKHLSENVVIERSAEIVNNQISRRTNSTLVILNKFPLSVSATNSRSQVRAGEEIVYTIRYKNEGDAPITNVRLEAVLPAGVEFVSSSGSFGGSVNGDSVVFTPGRMSAQQEQAVTIIARASDGVEAGEVLTMAVNVTYSDEFGEEQFNEKAFTTSEVIGAVVVSGERTALVAGLAGIFGGFFPGSAIGWLILVILLIVLAIIVRRTLE